MNSDNRLTYIIIAAVILVIFIAMAVFIIRDDSGSKKEATSTTSANKTNTTSKTENTTEEPNKLDVNYNYEAAAEEQMAQPKEGDTIAVMHVKGYGDITFKFFKDKAPKAVENFLTHAKDGYYDGVKFHRVINEFMIQSGDPLGNGTGGESIWGQGFEEEFDQGLVPYRGALCMASSGVGRKSLGSQFFIVQANYDPSDAATIANYGFPESLNNTIKKYGGAMHLYQSYTVFGQVVEGMDVVDKIAQAEVVANSGGEKSSPVNDIVIESIDVTTK